MGNVSNAQDNKLCSILGDLIVPVTLFCPFLQLTRQYEQQPSNF